MNRKIIQRLPQCFFGLFLCGFGLAFTIEAKLGLNPWDVFHDGFSKLIDVRIGFAGVITGFIVLLGWIPLKQKPFLGTILNILTIGNVLDLSMYFIPTPESIIMRHGYLYFGTVLFAMGVGIYFYQYLLRSYLIYFQEYFLHLQFLFVLQIRFRMIH